MRTKRQAEAWLTVLELLGEVQQLAEVEDSHQRCERTIWGARQGIWFSKKALAHANSNEEIERALKHRRKWEEILLRTKVSEKPGRDVMGGSSSDPLAQKRTIWYLARMNLYLMIRQKIEALPPTSSVEDVLKALAEYEPKESETKRRPDDPPWPPPHLRKPEE